MAIKVKGCTVVDDIRNITAGVSTVTTGCVTGTMTGATVCATTGCVTGTFTGATVCGGTVCATTGFSGPGANLSNIPSGAITGSLGGIRVCTYTSSGTFPVPPGTSTLKITAIGGGGNGGGPPAGSNGSRSGGGGAGAAAVKYLTVPPSCSSYPVTIGGAGGDTVFGGPTVFLLEGGAAGCNAYQAGPEGVPGAGGYQGNCGCQPSTSTYMLSPDTTQAWNCAVSYRAGGNPGGIYGTGGAGQSTLFGRGGMAWGNPSPTCSIPVNAIGYGSGGGSPGGTGAPGFMIVEW
jgi:hypothetical protein